MLPLFQNLDHPKACCTVNTAPLFWKYTLEPVLLGRVPVGHGTSDVIQADIKTIGWVLDNFKHIKHVINIFCRPHCEAKGRLILPLCTFKNTKLWRANKLLVKCVFLEEQNFGAGGMTGCRRYISDCRVFKIIGCTEKNLTVCVE